MSISPPPDAFLDYNTQQTKQLAIVVEIDGIDYLVSRTIGTRIRYGDPIFYGDPGLLYGGLRPIGLGGERGQRSLLSLDGSSLTISQRLEPEQGRGAISTLSMSFIDLNQYMTQVISPGIIVDDIFGKQVRVWLGYAENSFPDEYYVIFRGKVTQANVDPGRITLQFSDPNLGRRQQIFFMAKSALSGALTSGATSFAVVAGSDFHKKIVGPSGIYDSAVKLYVKIENEYIQYSQTGFEATGLVGNLFSSVLRGQRGTTAVAHASGTEVTACFELQDHAIDMALKLMLSGWSGFYMSSISIEALAYTSDPDLGVVPNAIVLPSNKDGVRDYGLQPGDYITITGATNPANNVTTTVTGFQDSIDFPNKLILVAATFTTEPSSPALLAFRSQYDTYPISFGSRLTPNEVDVEGHVFYKNTFLGDATNRYRFFQTSAATGKTFIESEIYLPLGAYSLTRQGKLSMGLTKPPLADQRLSFLDNTNILEPQNIRPSRGINNRKFFNEVQWQWDFTDDGGDPVSNRKGVDTESLSIIGISSVLPITTKGSRSDLGFNNVVERRERFLLFRYGRGAVLIPLKVNFETGNQIEAGDVVVLTDNGELQITNMQTGVRLFGSQLMEVIDRTLDIKSGNVSLVLQTGVQANVDDRFATIAPSSRVDVGSSTTRVRIKPSYGQLFGLSEFKKWKDYVGLKIIVHSFDWTTRYNERTFTGFASDDVYAMLVDTPLTFTPLVDDIVDIILYPTNTDPMDQQKYKLIHAFWDRSAPVTSGVSTTQFNVSASDAALIFAGDTIVVHNAAYTDLSAEVEVLSSVGTLITVTTSLGFTPTTSHKVELIRFADRGGPYKWI